MKDFAQILREADGEAEIVLPKAPEPLPEPVDAPHISPRAARHAGSRAVRAPAPPENPRPQVSDDAQGNSVSLSQGARELSREEAVSAAWETPKPARK